MAFTRSILCAVVGLWVSQVPATLFAGEMPKLVPNADAIPQLTSHSETTLTVYEGDKIDLAVKATGEKLLYRWVRYDSTVCRTENCVLDTKDWGLGRHRIVLVVYNRFGSQTVRYVIKVLARVPDAAVTTHRPAIVTPQQPEALGESDLYVSTIRGLGYSYNKSKVQVIGDLPRALEWVEKIKAHSRGTVKFGRKKIEEHFVANGSVIGLVKTDSGRRAIRLMRGAVRSRQLKAEAPNWSILIAERLQVDTDASGDVMVAREPFGDDQEKYSVTVFRGNARVYYQLSEAGESLGEVKSIVVPSGVRIEFSGANEPSYYMRPEPRLTEKVLRLASPQYFLEGTAEGEKKEKQRGGGFLNPDIKSNREIPLDKALASAKASLEKNDPFMALEYLLPLNMAGLKSYEYNLSVANAYFALGALKEASRFYLLAQKLDPKAGEPDFGLGVILLEQHKWSKAIQAFDSAEKKKHSDRQAMDYYRGVAEFNSKELIEARNFFKHSLWDVENTDIEASARKFLMTIADTRPYGAVGAIGFGTDSNVFRYSESAETREDQYLPEKGNFYLVYGKLYYNGFSGEDGSLQFGFELTKKGYLDSKLKDVGTLYQKIYANWSILMGDVPSPRPYFKLDVEPYIGLLALGEQRTDDVFALNVAAGSPRAWLKPTLLLHYSSHSDPLPTRDDRLDPMLMEVVVASDRSGTFSQYGLGLNLYESAALLLDFEARMGTMKHENEIIQTQDYSETLLNVKSDFMIMPSLRSAVGLGYLSRAFPDSIEDRSDKATILDLGVRYSYSPAMYNDLKLNYISQTSSVEFSTYKRYEISLLFTLDL